MKRLVVVAVIAQTIWLLGVPAPASAAGGDFRFEGAGFGHGVGMSQYGAQSQAVAGRSETQILNHYFTGANVAPLSTTVTPGSFILSEPLWVGIMQNVTTLDFQAVGGSLALCQSGDGTGACPNNGHGTPTDGQTWSLRTVGPKCQFYDQNDTAAGPLGDCTAAISWSTGTRVYLPGKGESYARGELKIRPGGAGGFHVLIVVGLEDYLHGVDEMPLSWHPEALEAQVIASRSYAVYQSLGRGPESAFTTKVLPSGQTVAQACWCHVFDSTADQNYDGWSAESDPTYGAKWLAAIAATAGKIVTHTDSAFTRDGVALTVFSSSSGGATESNVSGFGSAVLFPYLDTVPDAWSRDPFNPLASWTTVKTSGALAAAIGVDSVSGAVVTARHPSGSTAEVVFDVQIGGTPQQKVMSGHQVKTALGLKSIAFNICIDPVVCPYGGPDEDTDGVPDGIDNCPSTWNPTQVDSDGDGIGDACDPVDDDPDRDGVFTAVDNCPAVSNPGQADIDGDGIGDACDPFDDDPDRDGILTGVDNCSGVYNPDQADSDGNGLGDMCDPWDDVSILHWARDSIQSIYDSGISNGCNADPLRFCPGQFVNRAEMAAFLLRATGNPPSGPYQGIFADVPGGAWYALDAEHMYAQGFTAGCAGDPLRYCPLLATSRAEVAVFLVRVLGMEDQLGTGTGSFSDLDPGAWYADAVALLSDPDVGILNGYPDGTYRPDLAMTRAEMASLLDRTFLQP
ncbi:MAG: thrombospondin type 3 repeat-containing protein [Acidimicrobiia bacterium]|nr:thrombospondin type 3 repeat-containing protein [Acidimicrobiia bacterium]